MNRGLKRAMAAVLSTAVICSSMAPVNVFAIELGDCEHSDATLEASTAATCNADGIAAYWTCTDCS
ncbi:MAG: hypothetical protein NC089_07780, partial [Bacteroides sp.]|nr:hypothetical protein [Bacteroides sp.]MCM1548498.1 hypothetical protein [Clostridium sp.]